MAKVLLTGGAGFIGSNFLRLFVSGKFPKFSEIVILDKLTYAGEIENISAYIENPAISFHQGDICDFELVTKVSTGCDYIINMAAESHVDRSIQNSEAFVRTNILGVQVLLDVSLKSKSTRFVQVSTDEVYGSIDTGSWNEESPLKPNSPYSASKASADLLVNAYHVTHGLNSVITRCSNNFGPGQYPEKIIPFFLKKLVAGERVPLYGNGEQTRDWLYVEDHCQGVYIAATSGESGHTYNIGGGVELMNIDLARLMLQKLRLPESFIEYVPDRLGHDTRYSVDWSKIGELGYVPRTNFKSLFNTTVEWYQEKFQA